MGLQNLRPRGGADLGQLCRLMAGKGWRAALPESLPENTLLRLAWDFRAVETYVCGDDQAGSLPSLAQAMYVVMNVLHQHPYRESEVSAITVSDEAVMRTLQTYQWSLEREIVSRIVGLAPPATDALLDALWSSALEREPGGNSTAA